MRKVLSFVLVLALVLSSFSMAFAGETVKAASLSDIAGNANEDAIQVAFDLGIVTGNPDGTFLPDKAVNRAEFAAMLTRALDIPDSALAGYTTTSFKDTTGYSWAVSYLAFCQSKGILLGDGAGNVMPGRTITVNEAMTMALRAIGYTANSSLLVGAWPSNYVTVAQNEDMYDDLANPKADSVDKADAAQIIYNLLTVQKVSVNTDGTTDYLWKNKSKDQESNLLNTNLGCDSIDDAILGSTAGTGYDDSDINITGDLGAHGTAYINDDDDVVAFTKDDSVALTGKLNDDMDKFEVGDVKYDIDDSDNDYHVDSASVSSAPALFANGDATKVKEITTGAIKAFAAANSDDKKTVTLNVDLSGKTIKDVYSVVAWKATTADKADSDVQDEITDDHSLLSYDFVENDDDNIDMNSFELVGAASLDKIAKDNVVYVYTDGSSDDNIRKVAVGTETVQGSVDEISTDDDGSVTINGKEYDIAPCSVGNVTVDEAENYDSTMGLDKIKVDSDGTFYLDAFGKIYDFDGTSGNADTYGVVKAFVPNKTDGFDNAKVKLYKSDDSTSTLYFSEAYADLDDMDWTTSSAQKTYDQALNSITGGALIGYSLDSTGDIDAIDTSYTTVGAANMNFQSTKVLKATIGGNTKSYSIDSDCVVFTYKNDMSVDDYDISSLKDVETGTLTGPAAFITNDDGDVVALLLEDSNTEGDNYVYAVFNDKTTANDDSGDKVAKFTGYIDGASFAYKSDDENKAIKAGNFYSVYKIKVDSSNVITDINTMYSASEKYDKDNQSGWIVLNTKIKDLGSDKTVITDEHGDKYTISDDAVVYKYDTSDKSFAPSKVSALKDNDFDKTNAGCWVSLYDTEGKDADGVADLVVFYTK